MLCWRGLREGWAARANRDLDGCRDILLDGPQRGKGNREDQAISPKINL
jgi:hypothetical protein